jgi:hypothetical protein
MEGINRNFRRIAQLTVALATFGLGATHAFGAAINLNDGTADPGGKLAISNLVGTFVGVTTLPSACINWGGGSTCAGGVHNDLVSGEDPGYFAPGTGTITDIAPPGGTVVNFETADGGSLGLGTVHFDLINIMAPTGFPICNGSAQVDCSTGIFILQQSSPTQVSISFSVNEEAYTGTSGVAYNAATAYVGTFSTTLSGTLPNGTLATVANLEAFEGTSGTVTSTWSGTASPVSTTPEPATLFMFGSGLFGVAMVGRRATRRSK